MPSKLFQALNVTIYIVSGWLAWEISKLTLNTLVGFSMDWAAQLPNNQGTVMFLLIFGIALLVFWIWVGIFSTLSFCIKKLDRIFRAVNEI
jgi:hypothetical protein